MFNISLVAQKSKVNLINAFVIAKHKYHNFNENVLVAEKDRIIYKKSFGYSDFNNKKSLIDESVFNLASISKHSNKYFLLPTA